MKLSEREDSGGVSAWCGGVSSLAEHGCMAALSCLPVLVCGHILPFVDLTHWLLLRGSAGVPEAAAEVFDLAITDLMFGIRNCWAVCVCS